MPEANSTQLVWFELSQLCDVSLAYLWNAPDGTFLSTLLLVSILCTASGCPDAHTSTTQIPMHVPFICRLAALVLVIPFALCIGLDLIAYGEPLHFSQS